MWKFEDGPSDEQAPDGVEQGDDLGSHRDIPDRITKKTGVTFRVIKVDSAAEMASGDTIPEDKHLDDVGPAWVPS